MNDQMPIVNNEMSSYESTAASLLDPTNNLAAYNNLNVPINDNLILLINALNGMKIGDIAQNFNGLPQQQHTCGMNSIIDCNASTIGPLSVGCTKKYQKTSVPSDYMCHLCFSKDHFIRDCPQVKCLLK